MGLPDMSELGRGVVVGPHRRNRRKQACEVVEEAASCGGDLLEHAQRLMAIVGDDPDLMDEFAVFLEMWGKGVAIPYVSPEGRAGSGGGRECP